MKRTTFGDVLTEGHMKRIALENTTNEGNGDTLHITEEMLPLICLHNVKRWTHSRD
jgi:hypothetical protein